MILQRLHNEYHFNIEMILLKEYKRLNLSTEDLNVLIALFSNTSKKKVFSISVLTKKLDYNSNKVAELINSLMDKKFLEISFEQTNERSREVYTLDNTYTKIEDLFHEDYKIKLLENNKSNIGETIELLEEKLSRLLNPNELDRVRTWYDDHNFKHSEIIKAINSVTRNINVLYVEKLLSMNISPSKPLDQKTEDLLDKIYKGL